MHTPKIDPYRAWFNIGSYVDDVPNHYQLLGVSDFESDIEFIKEAYKARVDYLNLLDITGPNRAMKPRVLSQLETALETLSDAEKKKDYDSWLLLTGRAGLPRLGWRGSLILTLSFVLGSIVLTASVYVYPMYAPPEPTGMGDSIKTLPQYQNVTQEGASVQTNLLASTNIPEGSEVDPLAEPASAESGVQTNATINNDDLNAPNSVLATDFASDLEAIPVADIPVADIPSDPIPVANDNIPEAPAPSDPVPAANDSIPEAPVPSDPIPAANDSIPEVPASSSVPAIPDASAVPAENPAETPVVTQVENSPFAPDPINTEPSNVKTPANNVPETSSIKAELVSTEIKATNPAVNGRFLIPQEADWKKYESEIADQYKLNSSSSQENRLAAVKQMLTDCALGNQPAEQKYALLQRAAEEASEGSDAELALQSIVAQSRLFAIDLPQSVAQTMEKCAQSIKTEAEAKKLMDASLSAANFCMEAYEYATARAITEAVYKAVNNPAGQGFRSQAMQRLNKAKQFEAQWSDVLKAKQELASTESPQSAAADVIARWYIETEEDWNCALPYLLRSANPELRQIAQKDNITPLSDPKACLELGDLWWNFALNQSGAARQAYQRHAIEFYKNAAPGLDEKSLDRTRIQKRIEDSEK